MLFNFLRPKVLQATPVSFKRWRVEFTSNGVLIHGNRVEAVDRESAIHRALAQANAEMAMRGSRLKYESVVASLA